MNIKQTLQLIRSKIIHYVLYVQGKTPEQLWNKKLAELLVGVPNDKVNIYKTVLNNQHIYAQMCTKHEAHLGAFYNEIDSERIVKKILDNLTTMDLIGVQPMQGPVGLVFALQYKEVEGEESTETLKRLTLEIISQAIEARSRKLQAKWTLEAAQDLKAMHNIDIRSEIESAIAAEITTEICNEHIQDLMALAEKREVVVENTDQVLINLNKLANEIARKTRRGAGNWIVMDPAMYARLQLKDNKGFKASEGGFRGPVSLLYVGTLYGTMKVYVNTFTTDSTVLVGYRGSNEVDTGYTWSPYVTLMSSGVIIDPDTFSPMIGLMTRYGKHVVENASAYYKSVKFTFEG